jgi:hypothetical protein
MQKNSDNIKIINIKNITWQLTPNFANSWQHIQALDIKIQNVF